MSEARFAVFRIETADEHAISLALDSEFYEDEQQAHADARARTHPSMVIRIVPIASYPGRPEYD